MKIIICLLLAGLSLGARAQNLVSVPINISGTVTVALPDIVQTNITIITNVTTIQITTNITQVIVAPATKIFTLTNNVIDGLHGPRVQRNVASPTTFLLGQIADDQAITFYFRNVNASLLTWPPGIVWVNAPAPTNQMRGAVLFEKISAEIWATQ